MITWSGEKIKKLKASCNSIENVETPYQNLWDTMRELLRGKYRAQCSLLKKWRDPTPVTCSTTENHTTKRSKHMQEEQTLGNSQTQGPNQQIKAKRMITMNH